VLDLKSTANIHTFANTANFFALFFALHIF